MSEQIEEKNMQVDETVEEVSPESRKNPELDGHDDHAEGVRETDTPDENQDVGSDGHDDQDSSQGHDDPGSDEQDTFDRTYVEKLRKESAKYREKAKRTEALERRLHHALVAADGRLADPDDLPFDETHLDDPEALAAAVTALVKAKPGLKAQKFTGSIGAGDRGTPKKAPVDLISLMRGM
ncbi:MAG: hypothetical protein L0L18_08095 [Acidipropionibacterium jensenii]|nr:hypothetical protein [Acidipropionibacterium jensenii]